MRAFLVNTLWIAAATIGSTLSPTTDAFCPLVPALQPSRARTSSVLPPPSQVCLNVATAGDFGDASPKPNIAKALSSAPWFNIAPSLRRPAAVIVGSTFAFFLQHTFSLPSPLVAPVTLGMISATAINLLDLPLLPYQAPFYVGAFAGTTSTAIMSSLPAISLLSLVVVSFFELFERKGLFPGKGGRLGACATMSSAVFALLLSRLSLLSEFRALLSPPFNAPALLAPFAFASAGAVACTALRRKDWTPVTASAALGTLGTLGIRGSLGGFFYAGTFIGMSANANDCEQVPYKSQILAAAFLALFFQTVGQNILAGVGGKLGAAACAACVTRDSLEKR